MRDTILVGVALGHVIGVKVNQSQESNTGEILRLGA